MPPKKNTRAQSKAVDKKKKDEEEEQSEEEEDKKKTTAKGKKGAKGKMDVEDKPAPRRSTRSSSRKAKDDDEEEESDEDVAGKKPTKKVKGGRGKKAADSDEDDDDDDDDEDDAPTIKKAIVKGGAAVDEYFDGPDCHVYNDGKTVYTTTMNQSNLNRNNNKFYIVQLLETEGKTPGYYTWNRWGRVGVKGQTKATRFGDVNKAMKDYEKKIHEKSVKGDYKIIDINYDDDEEEEDKKSDTKDDKKKTDKKKDDEDDKKDKKDKKEPAKKASAKKKDDDDDDDKDKKEPAKKPAAKKKDDDDEEEEKQVKVITKGGIAIDQFFTDKDCEIYCANGKVYAKTLNQSNLNHNNNKFYIIQVLKDTKKPNTFYTWNRWGRVGVPGQNAKKVFSDAASAVADFEKKLHDKTVKGDYREVEINYDDEEEEETKKDTKEGGDKEEKESKLPGPVKELIKLIFDLKMMNEQMKEIGYDPKKMPLGKLAKSSVQKGYEVLKQIAEAIEKGKGRSVLNELSGDFYSLIPHDFGFQQMSQFVIDTDKKVKTKLEMLNSLADIQIATKLLSSSGDSGENQIDSHYKKLKCDLVPVAKNTDEHKMVLEYIKNTHATTHSQYSLELVDLFTTARDGEDARYNKGLHNKMLLWHGSRLTNYVGILSQGLRIAPPEAPVTGYMFGKGVYFADMVSKSANYCFTNSANNTGIMLLCEVALGNCNEKLHADYYAANLPPGKHSTKGLGKTAPPESSYKKIDGDIQVPIGKGENTGVQNAALLYNEFIVYDINQIKLKYLLRLKFNYRSNY